MAPLLSVVVVAYDMARELPRTLATLSPSRQRGIAPGEYEVIVVDNGSPEPVSETMVASHGEGFRCIRIDPAPPSPARAANLGIAEARGQVIGLVVDGARMSSPGLLAGVRRALPLAARPVITAPAWHLGSAPHMHAREIGHDQVVEDRLLASVPWETDGYSLFSISVFAGSSGRGIFGPMGESSSLFLPGEMWDELGGLDEAFDEPGGGLVNHDLYHRACSLPDAQLVSLLGEGTFHQFHGGAATGGPTDRDAMKERYEELRGRPYRPPSNTALHIGEVPDAALVHIERSAQLAMQRLGRRRGTHLATEPISGPA